MKCSTKMAAFLVGGAFALCTLETEGFAQIRDIPATHCEIFVDKIVTLKHRDYRVEFQLSQQFIKIDPAKLDGAVKKVAFFGAVNSRWKNDWSTESNVTTELKPFADSSDYFENRLAVAFSDANAGSGEHIFRGSYYVETDKGTRYWSNASDGDFVFDTNFAEQTTFKADPGAVRWSPELPSVMSIPKTADAGGSAQYVNPLGCR